MFMLVGVCVVKELEHHGHMEMTTGGALLPLTPLNDKRMVVKPNLPVQALGSTKPILLHKWVVLVLTYVALQAIVSHGWKVSVQVQGTGTI